MIEDRFKHRTPVLEGQSGLLRFVQDVDQGAADAYQASIERSGEMRRIGQTLGRRPGTGGQFVIHGFPQHRANTLLPQDAHGLDRIANRERLGCIAQQHQPRLVVLQVDQTAGHSVDHDAGNANPRKVTHQIELSQALDRSQGQVKEINRCIFFYRDAVQKRHQES